jgi:hypothetical protein
MRSHHAKVGSRAMPSLAAMKRTRITTARPSISSVIEASMEPVVLACTVDDLRAAFRRMFSAAYVAVADRHLFAFPPRDHAEFKRDLRHSIPIAAIGSVETAISSEQLLSANFKPGLLKALTLLRCRIDASTPRPHGLKLAESVVDLSGLLHDELCRLALRRSADWSRVHAGEDPIRSELATLHQERYDAFVAEQWSTGVTTSKSAIAMAAGTDRTGMRRYLTGVHGPDSEISKRIERVFSGERPLHSPRSGKRAIVLPHPR